MDISLVEFFSKFENWGSIASILGLFITLSVLRSVRRIRADFLFKARVPQLVEQIRRYSSNLSKNLQDYDNSIETIEDELAKCISDLKNLKSKLSGDQKKSTNNIIKLINKRKKSSSLKKEHVREIYRELLSLIQELNNLLEDKKWDTNNGQ